MAGTSIRLFGLVSVLLLTGHLEAHADCLPRDGESSCVCPSGFTVSQVATGRIEVASDIDEFRLVIEVVMTRAGDQEVYRVGDEVPLTTVPNHDSMSRFIMLTSSNMPFGTYRALIRLDDNGELATLGSANPALCSDHPIGATELGRIWTTFEPQECQREVEKEFGLSPAQVCGNDGGCSGGGDPSKLYLIAFVFALRISKVGLGALRSCSALMNSRAGFSRSDRIDDPLGPG